MPGQGLVRGIGHMAFVSEEIVRIRGVSCHLWRVRDIRCQCRSSPFYLSSRWLAVNEGDFDRNCTNVQ